MELQVLVARDKKADDIMVLHMNITLFSLTLSQSECVGSLNNLFSN